MTKKDLIRNSKRAACELKGSHPVTYTSGGDADSALFSELSAEDREKISWWINEKLVRRGTPNMRRTSHYLNILLARDTGVRISNNQFKDAMLENGYRPARVNETYWSFPISESSPCFEALATEQKFAF